MNAFPSHIVDNPEHDTGPHNRHGPRGTENGPGLLRLSTQPQRPRSLRPRHHQGQMQGPGTGPPHNVQGRGRGPGIGMIVEQFQFFQPNQDPGHKQDCGRNDQVARGRKGVSKRQAGQDTIQRCQHQPPTRQDKEKFQPLSQGQDMTMSMMMIGMVHVLFVIQINSLGTTIVQDSRWIVMNQISFFVATGKDNPQPFHPTVGRQDPVGDHRRQVIMTGNRRQ